jgi:predicted ferric reductase
MTSIAKSPLRLLEALATPHGLDRYLELVNPMLTVRELRGEITEVRRTTPDSIVLTVRPTRQWRGFRAGQFVQVTVVIDGVRRTRCYSPSDSQLRDDGRFELTVKAHPGGLVSQWLHANARPGLVLALAPADGAFTLPDPRPERLLFVSGGSGITPVLSMLRTLCAEATPARSCSCTTPTTPSTCRTARRSNDWRSGTTTCASCSPTPRAMPATSPASSPPSTSTRSRPGTAMRRPSCAVRRA